MPPTWTCPDAVSHISLGPIKLPAEFMKLKQDAIDEMMASFGVVNRKFDENELPNLEEIPSLNETILCSLKEGFKKRGSEIASEIFSEDSLKAVKGKNLDDEIAATQVKYVNLINDYDN